MQPTHYAGEHLWYGQAGHLLIILSFAAALLSCVAYFFSMREEPGRTSWMAIARTSFLVHVAAVYLVIAILFYLIYNHFWEYYYVWHHSSMSLPVRYMLACFWEGQEGSFLLWIFWHTILSFFVIKRSGEWEAPVLGLVALVQVFLTSMLLGVFLPGYRVGSDPFILLRDHPEMAGLPFVSMGDYLSKITDGRGLNPLLQNYWMVIHPPILFLGFAACVLPFAYALAGMLRKQFTSWITPAIPWTLFAIAVLGTGILMGAAWAYEALSFGGFWAWDPVENASLVPWITLIASVHLMLVYKHTGRALLTTYLLTITSFLLILYSTFLTRSGILGDSSVHAFTDLGMSGQLIFYMMFFVILSAWLLFRNRKNIHASREEENLFSREFWMFIGSLVLVISAFQITLTTSLPVINKVFGTNFAPPVDIKSHYNKWQLPIAAVVSVLLAIGLFLKWKKSGFRLVFQPLIIPLLASVLLSVFFFMKASAPTPHYTLLFFTSSFAALASLRYFFDRMRSKMKVSPASLAHAGFGLLLLGALVSASQSHVISSNTSGIDLGKDFPNNENIMLVKGDTLRMGKYLVTYAGKEKKGVNIFYRVEYYQEDHAGGKLLKKFVLNPVVQTNPRMGNVSEPDTRHYLTEDIYTHITFDNTLEENAPEHEEDHDEYMAPYSRKLHPGDTIIASRCFIILLGLDRSVDKNTLGISESDLAVGARLQVVGVNRKICSIIPVFIIKDNRVYTKDAVAEDAGIKVSFTKIDPVKGEMEFEIYEKKSPPQDFIIMKAIVFPAINLLWAGGILFFTGTMLAVRKRLKQQKEKEKQ